MDAAASQIRAILPMREPIDEPRWVSIRPIERSDASALFDFYARLSPESRRRRFLACGASVSPHLAARFADAVGIVGVLREPGPRDGAIVAHAAVLPDGRGDAEVAFAVADELQGRGLGRRLVTDAVRIARDALRCRTVTASLSADNGAMRWLLRSAGVPVVADRLGGGTEELVLALSPSDAIGVRARPPAARSTDQEVTS
jgi:GNAT superfamily N-acetyltransferase